MRLLRRQCRCCNIWSTLFSVYLAGTIYLAFFQFKTGLLKGVKYETEWKGPSNDYERPLRQNMQKTQTYQPLSISAKLLFMSNAKNVSQDTSWRTTKKTANNSLHFNENKDPLIKDKPTNQRAENFNKKPEVETRNKSVEVEKHGRNQINGSENKPADAGHEGKLAMEGQGHKRHAVDSATNVKPAVDAGHHEKPSINSKNNKKLAEYYAAHGKPAEDVEHHGKPAEDSVAHGKPAEDVEHHGKPAEDYVAHEKPAEDVDHHEKPAEDVDHHGKLNIDKRKNATNQGKPVGENHGTRKREANPAVKKNPAVDAVHRSIMPAQPAPEG
ncbi:ribosome-binding protein 1-like [Watersipora subatra]|uniref:ribosome-binding protein 1-like n=1 Tax=Watersipora subatra TaxID=2589382 RepID=UPI00355B035D